MDFLDKVVCNVEVVSTPRQDLRVLLDAAMQHRASITLYADQYKGDIKRDFMHWVALHPEHELQVNETRVVTEWGWSRLITADSPTTHLRAVSIYYPMVEARVIEIGARL